MSIYVTMLYFDGESPEEPRPIRYQENKYPLDEHDRDGAFDVSYIPAHVGEPDWNAPDDVPLKPYLRFGMATSISPSGLELDGIDIMLDRKQVITLHESLQQWLFLSEEAK